MCHESTGKAGQASLRSFLKIVTSQREWVSGEDGCSRRVQRKRQSVQEGNPDRHSVTYYDPYCTQHIGGVACGKLRQGGKN